MEEYLREKSNAYQKDGLPEKYFNELIKIFPDGNWEGNLKGEDMEPQEEKKIASALARQAVDESPNALKIIVPENGHLAGIVFTLLTKVHQVTKDRITQIGYTSSDQQNAQLLNQKKAFVIVPKDIINNRPCVFHLPEGTKQIAAIQYLDNEVFAMPITCEKDQFQFKPGWFD